MEYKGLDLAFKVGEHYRYDGESSFYFMLKYNELPNQYKYDSYDDKDVEDEIIERPKQKYNLEKILGLLHSSFKINILHQVMFVNEDGETLIREVVIDFEEKHLVLDLYYDSIDSLNFAYSINDYPVLETIKPITHEIYTIVDSCREDKTRNKMSVFLLDKDCYPVKIPFKFNEIVDLNNHYNNDFLEVNEDIEHWITNEDKNGLIILNGERGSGKSTYIKHLIQKHYKLHDFVFITRDGLDALLKRGVTTVIEHFNNKVIILEDCENMLKERTDANSDTVVPLILNLTDGILSDVCKCKIIITFNVKLNMIDSALLRKGRCYAQYEFKKLARDKAHKLLNELGRDIHFEDVPKDGMTLSEIFYYDNKDMSKYNNKNAIGFNV